MDNPLILEALKGNTDNGVILWVNTDAGEVLLDASARLLALPKIYGLEIVATPNEENADSPQTETQYHSRRPHQTLSHPIAPKIQTPGLRSFLRTVPFPETHLAEM